MRPAARWGCRRPSRLPGTATCFKNCCRSLSKEPFLIVAVTGGTNTGKSVIFNHLAGSRTEPHASQRHADQATRCAACRKAFLATHDLASVFPDFEVRTWRSENDPLLEGADNRLFVRERPGAARSPRGCCCSTRPTSTACSRQLAAGGAGAARGRRAGLHPHAAEVQRRGGARVFRRRRPRSIRRCSSSST